MTGRLEGKVVLVTGASRNIGGHAASGFAAEGATVACNDLSPDVAQETVEAIRSAGGKAIAVPGDVTDTDAMAAIVDQITDQCGPINVLLNNAAIFRRGGLLSTNIADFRAQLDVIVTGTFVASQAVARSMVEAGTAGSIITILSTAAWQGEAGNLAYATAKSALINFTRSCAVELAPHGIRVNSLTPTVTVPDEDSERFLGMLEKMRAGGSMDFVGALPSPRLPRPGDYVGSLVFLASDDALLMTGSNITVDGGALAKYWPQIPARLPAAGPTDGTAV